MKQMYNTKIVAATFIFFPKEETILEKDFS